jgi:membrane protein DedA with SNARE-associated domain
LEGYRLLPGHSGRRTRGGEFAAKASRFRLAAWVRGEIAHTGAMAAPSTEKRRTVVAAAAVLTSVGLCGIAFAPALLTYSPLLLIAMSSIPRHLVLAAPLTDPASFMVVATVKRVIGCTMLYYLGDSFGQSGLDWLDKRYPKARRLVRWVEKVFHRVGPLVLFVAPTHPMCALAGNIRMPLWQFLPAVSGGQLIWVGLTYWLGDFLSEWTGPFTAWLSENVVSTTAACVIAVAAYEIVRRHRQRKRAESAVQGVTEL